jgi:hypothetical protein
MIIKIDRISRSGKNWETYVYVPDTYSFFSAVKHLKKVKGITINREASFHQVFDEMSITKRVKHFDYNTNTYRCPK